MAASAEAPPLRPAAGPVAPVPWSAGRVTSWLTTVDHKRIGILYIATSLVFFGAGGILALLIRTQLISPSADIFSICVYCSLMRARSTMY